MASPLSLLSFLFPLYIPLYTSLLFWAPSELRSKLRSQADKTGIELLLRSCMRPSLTKSKSGSHLCLSLSSPLPFSLVSFSNNKVLPASFGQIPEPWAVSWTLGGLLWPGCLPLWFFPPSFLFFWGCCSALESCYSVSLSCGPAFLLDLEPETHVALWFEVERGGACWTCPASPHLSKYTGCVWIMLGHAWSSGLLLDLMCKLAAGQHNILTKWDDICEEHL